MATGKTEIILGLGGISMRQVWGLGSIQWTVWMAGIGFCKRKKPYLTSRCFQEAWCSSIIGCLLGRQEVLGLTPNTVYRARHTSNSRTQEVEAGRLLSRSSCSLNRSSLTRLGSEHQKAEAEGSAVMLKVILSCIPTIFWPVWDTPKIQSTIK